MLVSACFDSVRLRTKEEACPTLAGGGQNVPERCECRSPYQFWTIMLFSDSEYDQAPRLNQPQNL
jgi:hypothetical protein